METYGINFHSSPQSYSHGLLGSQGWSPSSSVFSDGDCDKGNISGSNDKLAQYHQNVSIHFPMPPFRLQPVLPLSVKKSRAVSAMSAKDQASIRGFDSWGFNGEEGKDASTTEFDLDQISMEGLGIFTIGKAAKKPMRIELPDYTRRIFSAPAPPAYLDILNGFDESPEQEPDEYPFPIMPYPRYSYNMEEEKDKLQRLKESLSLQQNDQMCDDELHRQRAHFGSMSERSEPAILPERQAPSLAEQMAFASGQGDSYSWCSPSKRRSSSVCYLPNALQEISTSSQDERRMASRHVKQGVAANGSAPLPRSVSLQMAMVGQEAEVGSNWSHKGCDESDEESSDEEQYWLRPATPMDRSSFSQQSSCTASTIDSLDSSPILHGILSARDFAAKSSSANESDVDTPSTCATSVQSIDLNHAHKQVYEGGSAVKGFSRQESTVSIASPTDSPNSFYEFSYMLDENQACYYSPPADAHNFADQSFNGNTFSPALETLELQDMPPTPIGFAPSPLMDQSSIEPHPSLMAESECPTLPLSFSTSSVLERPRPVGRSNEKASFFGNVDTSIAAHQFMVKSKSATSFSDCRRPSTFPASSIKSAPEIPDRRSSLDASSLISPQNSILQGERKKTRRRGLSVSFVDLPSTKSLPMSSSNQAEIPSSSSSSRLSSKALNQVREACRVKAEFVRNIALDSEKGKELKGRETKKQIIQFQSPSSQIHSSASSMNSISSNSKNVALPTLLVARTNSQRKRGWTGVEETEPHVLAMAKVGVQMTKTARQSKAEALIHKPNLIEQGALLNMPQGVVLIVERKSVVRESFSYV